MRVWLISILTFFTGSSLQADGWDLGKQAGQDKWFACVMSRAKQAGTDSATMDQLQDIYKNHKDIVESNLVSAQVAEHLTGYPDMTDIWDNIYAREKNPKNEPDLLLPLIKMYPLSFKDPAFKRKFMTEKCQNTYLRNRPSIPVEMCVHSSEEKEKNMQSYLDAQVSQINSTAAEILKSNGKFNWQQALGNSTFRMDSVTEGNLSLGGDAYLPESIFLDGYFSGAAVLNPKTGRPMGIILPVQINGKIMNYFAPLVNEEGQTTALNPYFFIFGGTTSCDWNKLMEKTYGPLGIDNGAC